ncbi:hypothetical protein BKA70DRAFT_1269420 [Coprinopsis sp. MPI-PUGE-AT-0042]|nr:hypothetical protein BKA70DRAFT_1269420 [Coprinopsis sp. MPI-PUGE-AT-0042]
MTLPLDLLYATVDHLENDVEALKALCLTSKVLSEFCQRRLFRTVSPGVLVGEGPGAWQDNYLSPMHFTAFKEVVMQNGRLAAFVKHFYLRVESPFYYMAPDTEIVWLDRLREAFQTRIKPLIQRLTKLETLALYSSQTCETTTAISSPFDFSDVISSPCLSEFYIRNLSEENPISQAQRLRHFRFGSFFNQDHHEAAALLLDASTHLEQLTYILPVCSNGGKQTSIPTNLIRCENRDLFEKAQALRMVTFRIYAIDIEDDLAYDGPEWPRIFSWLIRSMTTLSGCPSLEEIRIEIVNASGPLFGRLSSDWRALDALLSGGTFTTTLKKVKVYLGMLETYIVGEDGRRLAAERDELVKVLFKETHQMGIVVEVFGCIRWALGFKGVHWPGS